MTGNRLVLFELSAVFDEVWRVLERSSSADSMVASRRADIELMPSECRPRGGTEKPVATWVSSKDVTHLNEDVTHLDEDVQHLAIEARMC